MKTLSKNAVKVMSGQLKLGLGGHQEGRQKTLLSCILSFDGISQRGRPVQDYEDEPRLCLFGLSLTIPPWMSSANTIQEDHEEHHCCRKKGDIANIRHHSHCHNRRWYTSFKSVPFFAQRTRNFGLFWLFCCKFAQCLVLQG